MAYLESTDGGATWHQISQGLYMPAVVYVITIDKNNQDVIYAGTRNKNSGTNGFNNDNNSYGGGIFKSIDGGLTWGHCNIPGNDDYVYDIEIDPTNSNIVYAAMHWSGVFKSTDTGNTWVPKNTGLVHEDSLRTRGVEINPLDHNTLYLATWGKNSFYRSNDGGETWVSKRSGLGGEDTKVIKISMDPQNPGTVYASTLNYGLFKTVNSGESWAQIAYLSYFHITLAIHPVDSQILFAGVKLTGLWKSTNGGSNWVTSHNGIQANNIVSALNDPNNPDVLYVSAYGNGLWKSVDNGKTWIQIEGLPDQYINTIVFKPGDSNTIYAGVRNNGVYMTTNGGITWVSKNVGIPLISSDEFEPSLIPIYDHPKSMLWYDEAYEDFVQSPEEQLRDIGERSTLPTVNTISISSNNPLIMIIGTEGKGILRSFNGGNSWQTTTFSSHKIKSSLLDSGSTTRGYVGQNYPIALTRTDDSTLFNWSNVDPISSGIYYQKVNDLIFDATGTNIIYAAASDDPNGDPGVVNGVFKSINYGNNWTNVGLLDYQVTTLLNHTLDPNWILAGTTDGLFISKDHGTSWTIYNSSIWNQTSTFLGTGYGSNLFLMGTDGGNLMLIKK